MTDIAAIDPAKRRKLSMHHMTGQTSLGRVPGMDSFRNEPQAGYEYDPFEVGDFAKGWVGGVLGDQLVPFLVAKSQELAPDAKYPWLASKYGKTVRSRSVIFAANEIADIASQPVAWAIRSALHKSFPGIAGDPGKMVEIDAPNLLAASFVKTVATGVAKTFAMGAFMTPPLPPPPPAPASTTGPGNPAPAPGAQAPASGAPAPAALAQPTGTARTIAAATHGAAQPGAGAQSATLQNAGVHAAATGPQFLGHDVEEVGKETAMFGVSLLISKMYDQTVGPIVQRVINVAMGRPHEASLFTGPGRLAESIRYPPNATEVAQAKPRSGAPSKSRSPPTSGSTAREAERQRSARVRVHGSTAGRSPGRIDPYKHRAKLNDATIDWHWHRLRFPRHAPSGATSCSASSPRGEWRRCISGDW